MSWKAGLAAAAQSLSPAGIQRLLGGKAGRTAADRVRGEFFKDLPVRLLRQPVGATARPRRFRTVPAGTVAMIPPESRPPTHGAAAVTSTSVRAASG